MAYACDIIIFVKLINGINETNISLYLIYT